MLVRCFSTARGEMKSRWQVADGLVGAAFGRELEHLAFAW
jgi:hypothetical protein